jgi:predicted transcriptional regulator
MWTEEEEQRLRPYVLRRCHPYTLRSVAEDLGRREREVRRHRRALRHRLRRVQGLAGRAGSLAA